MVAGLTIRGQETGDGEQMVVCRRTAATSLLSAVFCLLSPAPCYAEELPDPTRPPAEISAPSAPAAAPQESGLQSVIISPSRRAAIINGQMIGLGAKLGDAKLVEVNESGVVLQGPQGRRALALFPGVELKKKAAPPERKNPERKNKNAKRAAKDSPPARKADQHAAPKEGK
ncbi:MAG: hypothetical protein HZC43_02185 [Nitrosomonadales bacterium]|nr:hypothetical protein [Nitrosomonadales bacterium]